MKFLEAVKREKEFHEERFKDGKGTRGIVTKAYVAFEYADGRRDKLISVSNQKVLEIGCGIGINRAKFFKERKCSYTGIDISNYAIKENMKLAEKEKLEVEFIVDDANKLDTLKNRNFDLIIMSGVLHHLDFKECLPTLKSLLQKNGKLIMLEPMGTNPLINIFRKLTPKIRTKDEHPLNFQDFNYIMNFFPRSRFELHSITSLGMIFLILFLPKRIVLKFHKPLGKVDLLIAKLPIIRRLSWLVLIECKL